MSALRHSGNRSQTSLMRSQSSFAYVQDQHKAEGGDSPRRNPTSESDMSQWREGTESSRCASLVTENGEYTSWIRFKCRETSQLYRWQRRVYNLLRDWRFDAAIGAIIVLNSITVGLDQQFRLEKRSASDKYVMMISGLEHCFLVVYAAELFMRFFTLGPQCIGDHWVKFDSALVFTGVLNAWILEPFVLKDEGLAPLMVLRMGRLLRLARTVRLLVKFQVLWMLVRGLLTSAGTMLYTLVMLFIMLYIFGCIGFELITLNQLNKDDDEFASLVEDWFSDLPRIMLTLLQFVCLDSVGTIYRPMIEKAYYLTVYFVGIILVMPIVLMNLVTAVIVNGALEQAESDREAMAVHEEQRKKKMIRELRRIFLNLDEDGSGKVSREEIQSIGERDKKILTRLTNISNPVDIFNALDVNTVGELDIEDFCSGIWEVAISKVPIEMKRMEIQVDNLHRTLGRALDEQKSFRQEQVVFQRQQAQFLEEQASFRKAQITFREEVRGKLACIYSTLQDCNATNSLPPASPSQAGGPASNGGGGGGGGGGAAAVASFAGTWERLGGFGKASPSFASMGLSQEPRHPSGGSGGGGGDGEEALPADTPEWARVMVSEIRNVLHRQRQSWQLWQSWAVVTATDIARPSSKPESVFHTFDNSSNGGPDDADENNLAADAAATVADVRSQRSSEVDGTSSQRTLANTMAAVARANSHKKSPRTCEAAGPDGNESPPTLPATRKPTFSQPNQPRSERVLEASGDAAATFADDAGSEDLNEGIIKSPPLAGDAAGRKPGHR